MVKMMKSKSKRMPASKRYKIERKVREHNRKLRKQKTQEKKGRKKNMKLIVVPGNCPFRSQILSEANALRANLEAEKASRKEAVKVSRKDRQLLKVSKRQPAEIDALMDEDDMPAEACPKVALNFEELVQKAEVRGYVFQKKASNLKALKKDKSNGATRTFYKEFQYVVSESDVVVEVLDARDPLGTRSEEVEDIVRNTSAKRLIIIMNKSDLIPHENLKKWISYLRATCGVVVLPFKANTQKQKNRLGSAGKAIDTEGVWNTSKSVGASDLLCVLGSWAKNAPGGITVGVVGMPNVGKSSIINSLKRSRACTVGAKDGVTRSCQKVSIDSHLKIIDSPGVYLSEDKAMTAKRILDRIPKDILMLHYSIPNFESEDEFLAQIALKYNLLKKGGLPNPANAEQKVVSDWQSGHIKFFTQPPETFSPLVATFVPELGQPFDVDAAFSEAAVADAPENVEMNADPTTASDDDISMITSKKVRFSLDFDEKKTNADAKIGWEKSVSMNITRKTVAKKMRKSKKKSTKKADELSKVVENLSFD